MKRITEIPRQCLNQLRTSRAAHVLPQIEHVIYGVTYLLVGFTEWHGLYYGFGVFVLVCVVIDGGSEG